MSDLTHMDAGEHDSANWPRKDEQDARVFLRDLADRLMRVPAMYGTDQGDVDTLNAIAADMEALDAEERARLGNNPPLWRRLSEDMQETLAELECENVRDCYKDIAHDNLDAYSAEEIAEVFLLVENEEDEPTPEQIAAWVQANLNTKAGDA